MGHCAKIELVLLFWMYVKDQFTSILRLYIYAEFVRICYFGP